MSTERKTDSTTTADTEVVHSGEVLPAEEFETFDNEYLIDLLQDCLIQGTAGGLGPCSSTHEELALMLYKARGYRCPCGYCHWENDDQCLCGRCLAQRKTPADPSDES